MKHEYELLNSLFSGNQMHEIIRYNQEYNAINDEEDFIDMIWNEVQAGVILNKEERNRIFKNAIILSSRFSGMDQDLNGLILLDMNIDHHFHNFEIDNGAFTKRQLLEFVALSNSLIWGYYYEGNEKLTSENLVLIHRLHHYFWSSIKKNKENDISNYFLISYFKDNFVILRDREYSNKFQFLEKEKIEELVIYLSLRISDIIDYEELEEKNLLNNKAFIKELKLILKDVKNDYETDNDIFEDIYSELLEVEKKPKFNKLLILLLDKNYEDLSDFFYIEEDNKKMIEDIFDNI